MSENQHLTHPVDNTHQVIHDPNQVKSLDELTFGRQYKDMQSQGEGNTPLYQGTIEFLTVQPRNDKDQVWFSVRIVEAGASKFYADRIASGKLEVELAAEDFSIIPYKIEEGDRWHNCNYLVPV